MDTSQENVSHFQLRFQKIAADASAFFLRVMTQEAFDVSVNRILKQLAELFDVDRSYVFKFTSDQLYMSNTHEYCRNDVEPQIEKLQNLQVAGLPWWRNRIFIGQPIMIPAVEDLPAEAAAEKQEFERQKIKSMVCLPMLSARGKLQGFMGFDAVQRHRRWSEGEITLLQLISEIIATALDRRQIQNELRETAEKFKQITDNIGDVVWLSSSDQQILYVSPSYERIWGQSCQSLQENPQSFFDVAHPEDKDIAASASAEYLNVGRLDLEFRIIRPDNEIRWVHARSYPIRDAQGKIFRYVGVASDISSFKRSQNALQQSEARIVSILSNMNDVIWSASWPDMKLKFISPSAERLFGRPVRDFLGNSDFWDAMVHLEDVEMRMKAREQLKLSGISAADYRIIRPDGQMLWIHETCRFIYDTSYTPIRVDGNVSDVTARKLVEDALARRTAELERYFSTSLDLLCIADLQGRFCRLNPEWKRTLGYDIEELRGKAFIDFVHPDDRVATIAATSALAQGQEVLGFTNRYRCADGSYRWIEWRSTAVEGLIYAVARDITNSRQMEQQLSHHDAIETSLAKIATLFINLMPDEIDNSINVALAEVGRLLEVDRAYVFVFNHDLSESSNTHEWCSEGTESQIAALQHVPSQALPWWMEHMRQLKSIVVSDLEHLPPEADSERNLLAPQGIKSLLVVPLSWQGQLLGFIGFDAVRERKDWLPEDVAPLELLGSIIVNARKRAQDELELRELNANLEHRVQERTRELQQAQSKLFLQDKIVAIGQLAAGLAHEINNPVSYVSTNFATLAENVESLLQVIKAYREAFGEVAEGDSTAARKLEQLREVEENVMYDYIVKDLPDLFSESREGFRRITEIISSIRSFARHDAPDSFQAYDLNKGIEQTLIIARNSYKYNADLKLELGEVPEINAVSGQINQVLLNLVLNSAQAIKEIEIKGFQGCIAIKTWADNEMIYCEVADNGPGVPKEALGRVFDPFFTTKEPGKGTGLGLSISYDIIVNKHGGQLSASNRAEGGFSIRFALPRISRCVED